LANQPLNVALLIQSKPSLSRDAVTCIVHGHKDGRAAFDLAVSLVDGHKDKVQVLVLESEHQDAGDEGSDVGRWIRSQANHDAGKFVCQTKSMAAGISGTVIVIARDVTDLCEESVEELAEQRNVIVVQGRQRLQTHAVAGSFQLGAFSSSTVS
jgi:hypothetical protein